MAAQRTMGRRRMSLGAMAGLWLAVIGPAARADNWPTYQHDVGRSGVTGERLPLPLEESWVFRPPHGPMPAWGTPPPKPIEGILELPRVRFDDAFHVVVEAGRVFFGSSADYTVYCLEAATGTVQWTFLTGGAVRLAPSVHRGLVYVGSDDGWVYCLRADSGAVVWKRRGGPSDRKVLGHGRLMSLWPVRTGVLVDGDTAYFAAGIFPAEGVYFYAVRAADGSVVWMNDTAGDDPQSRLSPQGYLLASSSTLFVPMGRVSPAAFNRADGQLLDLPYFGKQIGGTYALLVEDAIYTGTEEMIGYKPKKPGAKANEKIVWFPGRRLIVTRDFSYMATDTELSALDRKTYPKECNRYQAAMDKKKRLDENARWYRERLRAVEGQIKSSQSKLEELDRQPAERTQAGAPGSQPATALKAQREVLAKQLQEEMNYQANLKTRLAAVQDQIREATEALKAAQQAVAACTRWRRPAAGADALILAGQTLVAGGQDRVQAIDARTGQVQWEAPVTGKARGLAAAAGRLFVSTDTGTIHCFGPAGTARVGPVERPIEATAFARDEQTPLYEAAAEAIVRETGVREGYGLVLGCRTGRLAFELAKRTNLTICAVDPDVQHVGVARQRFAAAGLYGVRVAVDQADLAALPYPDYFANLVVSEEVLGSGPAALTPGAAREILRVLKPLGGTACIGQPAAAQGTAPAVTAAALKQWLAEAGASDASVSDRDGVWARVVRGPLPGVADWTHLYADPGNTAASTDQRVKCPLSVLWFGEPGPGRMPSRHLRIAAPLVVNGRLFVEGEHVVSAYDVYNGRKLWEREIPGAIRLGVSDNPSNLAADASSLFVAVGARCLRLEGATGRTLALYEIPPDPQGLARSWGYVACVGRFLYGSAGRRDTKVAETLFAVDTTSGQTLWTHEGERIANTSISISDGRLFFIESTVTNQERQAALADRLARLKDLQAEALTKAQAEVQAAEVGRVTALDAVSGKLLWQRAMDLSVGARTTLATIAHDGVLLIFGVYSDGHFWKQFLSGEFQGRRIIALAATDGRLLWSKPVGYRVRPLVIGNTLHAEPWAFDLHTGQARLRPHPITGRQEMWQWARPGHHCGAPSGCPNALFARSWCLGYYDLLRDEGTAHFGAQRPGCWLNFIPANGVLAFPEASSGCMCPFPNMCTVVFQPSQAERAWAMASAPGPVTPVKHLAVNLGAPGDRRAPDGTLWLSWPRPGGRLPLVLDFRLEARILPAPARGYFRHNPETVPVAGTDCPWVYTSGCEGLTRCTLGLIRPGEEPGVYTVRLGFAETEAVAPGRRVFDVHLQDRVVLQDFDIVQAAGGQARAVVREFTGIPVRRDLRIDLVPKASRPKADQMPVLCAIEVLRTDDPLAQPAVAELKEPVELYNLGYWWADFLRQETGADLALVSKDALWSEKDELPAGPLRLGQLQAWLDDRRVVISTVEGGALIDWLTGAGVAPLLNPLSAGPTLYPSGFGVEYDEAAGKVVVDLIRDKRYTLAWLGPAVAEADVPGAAQPDRALEAASLNGLRMKAFRVLSDSTWALLRQAVEAGRLRLTRRYAQAPGAWKRWHEQILAAQAAATQADLKALAGRFEKETVSAGGIAWQLAIAEEFDRPGWTPAPHWQVLQGACAVRDGRLYTTGTTFLGYNRKLRAPVRLEFVGRQADPCDLSAFWGSALGAYEDGYFIGFGSNANQRNKILRLGEEVAGSDTGPLIVPHRWHHVIAQVLPGKVQLLVDGRCILEYVEPQPLTGADMIGIITWQDAEIDRVRVYTGR